METAYEAYRQRTAMNSFIHDHYYKYKSWDDKEWDKPPIKIKGNGSITALNIKTLPQFKKVIFNKPATIVIWTDGTKTVVKCADDDEYNKSAGIALCIMKKIYDDNFHKQLKSMIKNGNENEEREEAKRWRNAKPVES